MSEWIRQIVIYLLVVSAAMQMLPEKKYEPYVRLFTGLLLILFVLRPVLKIGSADTYLEQKIAKFIEEQEALESQIEASGEQFSIDRKELSGEKSWEDGVDYIEPVQVEVRIGP